jgi:hypothetical protein
MSEQPKHYAEQGESALASNTGQAGRIWQAFRKDAQTTVNVNIQNFFQN